MRVLIKKPGQAAVFMEIANKLEALQKIVGGWIDKVTLCSDLAVIYNGESKMLDLPYNCNICGVDFSGTVVLIGVKGDKFIDFNWAKDDIEELGFNIFSPEEGQKEIDSWCKKKQDKLPF